jgi:hypothetical protein
MVFRSRVLSICFFLAVGSCNDADFESKPQSQRPTEVESTPPEEIQERESGDISAEEKPAKKPLAEAKKSKPVIESAPKPVPVVSAEDQYVDTCKDGQQEFPYTGSEQTFEVPEGCQNLSIKMWGAGGSFESGGAGGYTEGNLKLTEKDSLIVIVGGGGNLDANGNVSNGRVGGYGGGGKGCGGRDCGYHGGGRSAILSNDEPLAVAGGGGSGTWCGGLGGAGGGTKGEDGIGGNGSPGTGAGASSGGTNGYGGVISNFQGGASGSPSGWGEAGGGGGGYFGGGGGSGGGYCGAAAGGGSGLSPEGGVTEAGSQNVPARLDDPDRQGAGAPQTNGRVIISWQ